MGPGMHYSRRQTRVKGFRFLRTEIYIRYIYICTNNLDLFILYECSKHSNKTGLQVGHLKDALVNHHEEEVHLIQ
jgi:hypothetical protein